MERIHYFPFSYSILRYSLYIQVTTSLSPESGRIERTEVVKSRYTWKSQIISAWGARVLNTYSALMTLFYLT